MTQSNTISNFLDRNNQKLNFYKIIVSEGEYVIVNKDNDVREFTTSILPEALFQAQYIDDMLGNMLNEPSEAKEVDLEAIATSDDIVPH